MPKNDHSDDRIHSTELVEVPTRTARVLADHSGEVLRVYDSRTLDNGFWHPIYGDMMGPKGWEIVPCGDAFVTRQVKLLGTHWIILKKHKEFTQAIGLVAPSANVEKARKLAEDTESKRKEQRVVNRQYREKKEQVYQKEFAEAVLEFLDFAPRYRRLAQKIAEGTARQATEVGSGRVGRMAKLELAEKAELAARAYIRQQYTKYEDRLLENGLFDLDRETHNYLKLEAHEDVDEFLESTEERSDISGDVYFIIPSYRWLL